MTKITQNTLMPVSFVGFIAYVIFMAGTYESELKAHTVEIERMRHDSKEIVTSLKSLEARLIRIEALLSK